MKSIDDLKAIYNLPLLELIYRAAEAHRRHHDYRDIQRCALLSIKTGGCPRTAATVPRALARRRRAGHAAHDGRRGPATGGTRAIRLVLVAPPRQLRIL